LELTREIAVEEWYKINENEFQKEMETQQQRSRAGSKDMFKQDIDWSTYVTDVPPTKFIWYKKLEVDTMKLLKDFEVGWQRILIFDQTPFYAESWGQIWDTWIIILDDGSQVNVVHVQKYNWVFLHFVK